MQQTDPPLSIVRQKVLDALQAMGASESACSETALLDAGYVVGRRFCQGGFQAVWLTGDAHIQVFNEAGQLIATWLLDVAGQTARIAA
jgi:hypothetical protein